MAAGIDGWDCTPVVGGLGMVPWTLGWQEERRLLRHDGGGTRVADEEALEAEQPLDARLLPAALACWGATILALSVGWLAGLILAVGLVVAAIGLWVLMLWCVAHRKERSRAVAVVALTAVLLGVGFALAGAWREHHVAAHPLRSEIGRTIHAVVDLADDPKPLQADSFGGERQWIMRADLRSFQAAGNTVRVGGKVVVLATGSDWPKLLPGQSVNVHARVIEPRQSDLTVVTLRATGAPKPIGTPPWWQRAAGGLRTEFAAAAGHALSPNAAGLLPALVVGDVSHLSDATRGQFKTAGLQHLCVVSGANFTILLTAVLFLARTLTLGPRGTALAAAATLLMFVIIARPDPSVLRAAAMGAVTLLAVLTGRRKQALPALCAALIGLLALWPDLAVSAGFALSAVATGGLILLAPSWADWLRARGWWRVVAEVVAVSAAAFVVTTPLLVAISGQVSVVAIVANVLVAPVVAPITVLGAIGAVLSVLWAPAAELALRCAAPPMWWVLSVAEHAAGIPGASITVAEGPLGGFTALGIIAFGVVALRMRALRRVLLVAALGVGAVLVPVRIWHPGWPPSEWVLAVCDVGQGDGLALSVGTGAAVLVDVGPDPTAIRGCLDRLRISRVPLVVLTHPHADHIGGLSGVLHRRSVSSIAVGATERNSIAALSAPAAPRSEPEVALARPASSGEQSSGGDGWAQVFATAAHAGIPITELSAGQVLHIGAVEFEVLAPTPEAAAPVPGNEGENANARSVVISAKTAAGTILLTGDIETPTQQMLLRTGRPLHADVLKLPHHGSRNTAREFLAAVHPRLAVVSVGADNTFGHPNPTILTELADLGTTIARTDHDGTILVLGPHPELRVVSTPNR